MEYGFEAMYDSNARMVYWLGYGITHDAHAAADATQTTFLRALENWAVLEKLSAPQQRGWLYKTCRNNCIDGVKRAKRLDLFADPPDRRADGSLEGDVEREDMRAWVWNGVTALPELYSAPIILHYFARLSTAQGARALGLSPSTYRSRLRRGRALLKEALEGELSLYE